MYSTTRIFSFRFTAEEIPEIESSASQLMDYTERLASARRAAPREDFLSTYLVAADQAGEMSPLEILIQLLFVIVAGMMRPVALPPSRRLSCSSTESSGKQCASSLELLSSLRAAAVGGVGRCLKVVPRNCELFKKRRLKPHIFFHIVDGERDTTGLNGKRILKRPRQPKLADELLPTTYSQPVALDSCSPQLSSSPVNNAATELWHLGAIKCL